MTTKGLEKLKARGEKFRPYPEQCEDGKWRVTIFVWNDQDREYNEPRQVEVKRPDLWEDCGGMTCALCGGATRICFRERAWCNSCVRYQ